MTSYDTHYQFLRLIKVLWLASFVAFLGLFMLMYVNMPEVLVVGTDEQGGNIRLDRSVFFYLVVGGMVLVNLALVFLAATFPFLPKNLLPLPRKDFWLANARNREQFLRRTKGWTRGIGLLANLMVLVLSAVVFAANVEDMPDLGVIFYPLLALLLVWKVYFFILFRAVPEEA